MIFRIRKLLELKILINKNSNEYYYLKIKNDNNLHKKYNFFISILI